MRNDFHKVIAERPRSGSSLPSRKTGWSTRAYDAGDEYALPVRESMSWNRIPKRKHFSDHLSPLQRYLDKQVGRPWRKVEAEIRLVLDLTTLMGRHLWDHAKGMVERDCWMDPDGRPHGTIYGNPVRGLYVHPRRGLLLRAKPPRQDKASERRQRIEQKREIRLDDRTRAERLGGLWFLFLETGRTEVFVETRYGPQGQPRSVLQRRPQILKKQANREEIARIRAAVEEAAD